MAFNPFENNNISSKSSASFNPFEGGSSVKIGPFNPFGDGTSQINELPPEEEKGFLPSVADTVVNTVGNAILKPAGAALDVISQFNRPQGALIEAVKAYQNDTPILEGLQKGFGRTDASWKETFDPEWVKENPGLATAAGFAADVFADPLIIATPAKAAGLASRGAKAIGLTDNVIKPAVNAVRGSELGRKAIATAEDLAGVNRIQEAQDAFRAGRATDTVQGQDIIDSVRGLKKQYGEDANVLTDYIQAAERGPAITRQAQDAVLNSYNSGKLLDDVRAGNIDKNAAFETLRDVGEEVPDYLLQESQRVAKKAGQSLPDYRYRDEVLQAIPDAKLRNSIQLLGDAVIKKNKEIQDTLLQSGRIGSESAVRFREGSHLRRSFSKYETPEKFLEAVRKNGTEEEWRMVYQDLSNTRAPGKQGFGRTHSVDTKDFIQRQVLSPETMKKMGLVTDPEYLIMDTLNRGSKTIREDEFLSSVNKMFGVGADEAADLSRNLPARRQYVQIPEGEAYGALTGRWVPRDVAERVTQSLGANQPEGFNALLQKMVSWWKVEKLANFASIARNFYSGLPMANVFGEVPMQYIPWHMSKITKAFAEQGKNAPILRELRETGILGNTWNRQELRNIIGDNPTGVKKLANWGMEAFGAPDKFWRAVVYSYHRDAGKSVQEAAKVANRALFDYGSAPGWIDSLSRSGVVPFARFPYFATKETARALYKNPAQVTKYTKIQNQDNPQDREAILPEYLRARQLLPYGDSTRMVNGKPQKVQNNLDLDYILPFSSDVSVGGPLMDAWRLATTGKNGLGQQVIQPGMTGNERLGEYARYAWSNFGPSFPLPGNYAGERLRQGFTGETDRMGRQYDPGSATAQTFLGLKNVPINTDEIYRQNMSNMNRQLRDISSMMGQIQRDQRLSQEEKKDRISAHQEQIKEIRKDIRAAMEAYQRQKKRGAI